MYIFAVSSPVCQSGCGEIKTDNPLGSITIDPLPALVEYKQCSHSFNPLTSPELPPAN